MSSAYSKRTVTRGSTYVPQRCRPCSIDARQGFTEVPPRVPSRFTTRVPPRFHTCSTEVSQRLHRGSGSTEATPRFYLASPKLHTCILEVSQMLDHVTPRLPSYLQIAFSHMRDVPVDATRRADCMGAIVSECACVCVCGCVCVCVFC